MLLYCLGKQAYQEYCSSMDLDDDPLEEAHWFKIGAQESPQLFFWEVILNTELDFFTWDKAVHTGDIQLYMKSLTKLQWLFFLLIIPIMLELCLSTFETCSR